MIACAAGALYFCMPVEKHGLHRELRYTNALIGNTVDGECQWGGKQEVRRTVPPWKAYAGRKCVLNRVSNVCQNTHTDDGR